MTHFDQVFGIRVRIQVVLLATCQRKKKVKFLHEENQAYFEDGDVYKCRLPVTVRHSARKELKNTYLSSFEKQELQKRLTKMLYWLIMLGLLVHNSSALIFGDEEGNCAIGKVNNVQYLG